MTAEPVDLGRIAHEMAVVGHGFGREIAAAWAVSTGRVNGPVIVAVGSEEQVEVVPARVFRHAVAARASGVVLAHNHPEPTGPSESDRAVTRRLVAAGRTLGIPLVAHLVVEQGRAWEIVSGRRLRISHGPVEPTAA